MCPFGFGCGCGSGEDKKEVVREVVREVVMIPCKYCGALFPQTATFCPNCGAKRTA
jgi:ribosomal protein L40E